MDNRYADVLPYTHEFVAEQRDFIDENELCNAHRKDAAEPATHRAWREILTGHSHIRGSICEIRCIQHDMGLKMSPRGRRMVEGLLRHGYKWKFGKPAIAMNRAQATLRCNLDDMPRRWQRLRQAEAMENGDTRQDVAITSPPSAG